MKKKVLKSIGILALAAFVGLQGSVGTVWAAEPGAMKAAVMAGTDAAASGDGAASDADGAGEAAPEGDGNAAAVPGTSEADGSAPEAGEEAPGSGDGSDEGTSGVTGSGNNVSGGESEGPGSGITGSGNNVSGGEDGDSGQTGKLATPVIKWEGWMPSWPAVEGTNGMYGFESQISRDGGNTWEMFVVHNPSQMGTGSVIYNMSMQFHIGTDENGAMFRFRAKALDRENDARSSEWSQWSESRTYTKPEKQLATVECWWDEANPGLICWNPVEGAYGYMTELYDAASDRLIGYSSEFNGKMQVDYSGTLAYSGVGRYYAKVWALSGDIDACANGDKAKSEVNGTASGEYAAPVPQWGWAGDGYNAPNAWNVSWTQAGIRVYDLAAEKLDEASGKWEWFGSTRVEKREYDAYMTRARILESGTYRFRLRAWYKLEDGSHKASDWSQWVEKTYTKPERKLGNVTGAWDSNRPGVFRWDLVDGAVGYWAELHKVEMDSQYPYGISTYSMYTSPGKFTEADFSGAISSNGPGQYYVIIRALSDDIDACANGDGTRSGIYDTRTTAETVGSALQEVLSQAQQGGDAAAALKGLTDKVKLSEIAVAMQTDANVLNQVKELEQIYTEQKGVTVAAPVVTEAAGALLDASRVSIAGAGLNAADASAISLQVDVAKPENRVDVPSNRYAGSVQLDISLKNGETSLHELKMPVTITMPVPAGLSVGKLTIVHYSQDGQGEDVSFRDNGDGTVTFTVTHFSTFLFGEKKSDGGENNGNNGNNGSNGNGGGNNQGTGNAQNGAAAQNAPLSPQTGQEASAGFSTAALLAVLCGVAAATLLAGSRVWKRERR
nr:hypothetical protein [uncultured Acetatifactor sp.]